MATAFFLASSVMAGSVPDQRTRQLPDASQNARPNLMPGTAATRASWRSSTDLMKCVWPRMKLVASGLAIFTVVSCISNSSVYTGLSQETASGQPSPGIECILQSVNAQRLQRGSDGL